MMEKEKGTLVTGDTKETPVLVSPDRPPRWAGMPRHEGHVPVQLETVGQALKFAGLLVDSGMLAKHIKTPAAALAIILTGQELGLPPMKSLRMIYFVEGNVTLKAELQLALFKQRGGAAVEEVLTDKLATWRFRHPNGDEHTETFTIEQAEAANLLNKSNWKRHRKVMLRWRAIAQGLRVAAPDMFGAIYDPDELDQDRAEVGTAERIEEIKAELTEALLPDQDEPEDELCEECGRMLTEDNTAERGLCLTCVEDESAPA